MNHREIEYFVATIRWTKSHLTEKEEHNVALAMQELHYLARLNNRFDVVDAIIGCDEDDKFVDYSIHTH
jgi:hypothetical protein